jgi:hypothetical protein
MPRPSKIELLSRFFPEIKEKTSKADKEQAIAYNTLACEVVLADLLRLYDKGLATHGPGALCVRLHQGAGESAYLSVADLRADQQQARASGDSGIEESMRTMIEEIQRINPEKAGLVLMVDNSSIQLFPIDRDYPARSVEALLEEFAA